MEQTQEEKFNLEKALSQIDEILKKLQDRDVSLEDSFALYKEGMELLKLCNENIEHVEKQMKILAQEGEDVWEAAQS
ncbi:MAG: exodeoxyribonuclease VII small subunit [Lachnospiraceae bacterium]|nr:exodeoxyribonuclease VII small subunit [Lachnospiraceae bacterium]MCD8362951.1 exodeoxyribonuclease VII small subunit [Lachnospiraceae bacterium]